MPHLISGGKISVTVFETFAETEAFFKIAPPFDGEVLIPFIPCGTIFDLTVLKNGTVFSEMKAVNLRQLNTMPVSDLLSVSRRIDGCVVLKMNKIKDDEPSEIKLKVISELEESSAFRSLCFPAGFGDCVMAEMTVKILGEALKAESTTHKTNFLKSDKGMLAEFNVNVHDENLVLNIFYGKAEKGKMMISRRLFDENIAYCILTPEMGNPNEIISVSLEPIGGMNVKLLNKKAELKYGESINCFASHTVIPPSGMRITDEKSRETEEIYFSHPVSECMFMPIEVLYVQEKIKGLEAKMKAAPFEDRCLIRDMINEICVKYKIAAGDIALVRLVNGKLAGTISKSGNENGSADYFRENMEVECKTVVDSILNSQTSDGVIADIIVSDEDILSMSTAVCLIALHLYTGNKYKKFAKRSVEFLCNKKGYWAKTAVNLWRGQKIDIEELRKKADMKIMYRRLDELAISIIKNFQEDKNDSNRM